MWKKQIVNKNQHPGISKNELDSLFNLYSNGSYREALEKIKIINDLFPNVPIIFNLAGACYKALGELKAAIKMFENAVKLKPDYAEAHKNLGLSFADLGQNESSINSFLTAIKIEPTYL